MLIVSKFTNSRLGEAVTMTVVYEYSLIKKLDNVCEMESHGLNVMSFIQLHISKIDSEKSREETRDK